MLKNIRSAASLSVPAGSMPTPSPTATPAPAVPSVASSPLGASKSGVVLKAKAAPAPAKPEATVVGTPPAQSPLASGKLVPKTTAVAKPAAVAPATSATTKAKGKEMLGVTLDATGEGTVRVYIGESWRAFYLTGSTTADDLCNMIQTRCAPLLQQSSLDPASCGLFELKNMSSTRARSLSLYRFY